MSFSELTPIHYDFLKEVTNIGGGNAATSLAQLLNKRIDMEVPTVRLLSYDEIFTNIKEEESPVIAISLKVLGDAPGIFLFVLEEKYALHLAKLLLGKEDLKELDDMVVSALKEVVNIIASSYINALTRMLNLNMVSSVPQFSKDMFGAILTTAYIESGYIDDKQLIIENIFIEDNKKINGYLFFIPSPNSLDTIISSINI
ncbi:MAG: chemotaxis protein CheC [Firmicutes bacterium]|nr:chemotaxis protein CheC [Bacillota bacterium]MTI69510.1 chemotaxis protein CheC [Bacillota bacterium]